MNEAQLQELQKQFHELFDERQKEIQNRIQLDEPQILNLLYISSLKGDKSSINYFQNQLDSSKWINKIAIKISDFIHDVQNGKKTKPLLQNIDGEEIQNRLEIHQNMVLKQYLDAFNLFTISLSMESDPQGSNNLLNELRKTLPTDCVLQTFVKFYMGSTALIMGNLGDAIIYYTEAVEKLVQLNNMVFAAKCYNNIGTCFLGLDDLENAEKNFRKSLEFVTENIQHDVYHIVLFNIGLLLVRKGELNEAVHYLEVSRKLSGDANNLVTKGRSAHMIGIVHDLKGNLREAEKFVIEAKEDFEKANYTYGIALCLNSLGNTYYKLGKYIKSYDLTLNCFQLFQKLNYSDRKTLFNLYNIAVELELEDANKYYDLLQEHKDDYYGKLAYAINLKRSNRYKSITNAQIILEEIVDSASPDMEQKNLAILELLDILLSEYENLHNPDIVKEIREKTNYLDRLAQNQHSYWQKVQVEMLKAQMYLIERNSFKARRALAKAQELAEQYNFHALEAKITIKMDELVNMINRFDPTVETEHILEEMGITSFKRVVKEMIRMRVEAPQIPDEEGVVLLIIHHDITIYSYIFDQGLKVNEILIGSFISALKMLLTETFDEEGPFDMIRKGENIILYKEMDDFGFCYVIRGNSYHARKKLLALIRMVREDKELLEEFNKSLSKGIVKQETAGILERYILHSFKKRES